MYAVSQKIGCREFFVTNWRHIKHNGVKLAALLLWRVCVFVCSFKSGESQNQGAKIENVIFQRKIVALPGRPWWSSKWMFVRKCDESLPQ